MKTITLSRFTLISLFSMLSMLSRAEPIPPEFFGIYLVMDTDELVELKESSAVNVCYYFVPLGKNSSLTGDNDLLRSLRVRDTPHYYIQMPSIPSPIDPSKLKGFVVYGDFDIQDFFIYQFSRASTVVPKDAIFVDNNPRKSDDARAADSYFEAETGWSLDSSFFRYKELKPKCNYVVFREGKFVSNKQVACLAVGFRDAKRRWPFGWKQSSAQMDQNSKGETSGTLAQLTISDTSHSSASQRIYKAKSADGRFIKNMDGTVTDLKLRLLWQESDDGIPKLWQEAQSYAESLVLGNKTSWRLPTSAELISLIDGNRNPTISEVFECQAGWYWNSTRPPSFGLFGAGTPKDVDFSSGKINDEYTHYGQSEYVRCVHGLD